VEISTKGVEGEGVIISCAIVSLPRSVAEGNQAVPVSERIEQAKISFEKAGMGTAGNLIDAIRLLETPDAVIGYFGFTIDRDGLTRTPLQDGETMDERGMKIMRLPHPQWGHRTGIATAIGDLVTLAEDLTPDSLTPEQQVQLSEIFSAATAFLSKGSSEGSA